MDEGILVYSRKIDEARYKKALTEVIRNAQLSGPLQTPNVAAHAATQPENAPVWRPSEDTDSDASGSPRSVPQPDGLAPQPRQEPDSNEPDPLSPNTARNIKNYQRLAAHQFGLSPGDASRGPLLFSSSFEAANLASARYFGKDEKSDEEKHMYELLMEGDTHAVTHTQWYNFIAASSSTKQEVVVFKIVNFRKKRSLHSAGMKPYVYSERAKQWDPLACTNVGYGDCGLGHRTRGTYVLTFTYSFHPLDSVQFAMYPPYSYTTLRKFVSTLLTKKTAQHHVSVHELCRSIGSVPVPLLLISQNMGDRQMSEAMRPLAAAHTEVSDRGRKRSVVIIARQHAGEIVCSYMVEGLIRFLVSPSREALALRENYIFHVVPMVNVDGVIYGNSRCTLAGVDPNRVWSDPNPIMHPVVYAIKEYMRKVLDVSQVELFLDFHGHSQKCGTFFYGCGSTEIRNAVFPKIASLATCDVFFDECRWRVPGRGHTKTARHVVYKQFDIAFSYTIEASFFAQHLPSQAALMGNVDQKIYSDGTEYPYSLFTPFRVETIGLAIGRSMTCFFKLQPRRLPNSPAEDETEIMPPELEARFHTLALEPRLKGSQGDNLKKSPCPWLTFGKLARAWPDDVLDNLIALGSSVHDLVKESDYDAINSHSSDDDNNGDGDKDRKEDRDKTPSKSKGDDKDRRRSVPSKLASKRTPRGGVRRQNSDDNPTTPREARGSQKAPKREDSWPLRSGRKRTSTKREVKCAEDPAVTPQASKRIDLDTSRKDLTGTSSASTTDSTHSVNRPAVDLPTVRRPAVPAGTVPADNITPSESPVAGERTNAAPLIPLDDSWGQSRAPVFAHNTTRKSAEDAASVVAPSIEPSGPSHAAKTDSSARTRTNSSGQRAIDVHHVQTVVAFNDAQGSSVKALRLHARAPSKSKRGTISSSSPYGNKSESSQSYSGQRASPLDTAENVSVQATAASLTGVERVSRSIEHSEALRSKTHHRPFYHAASPRDVTSGEKGAPTSARPMQNALLDLQTRCVVEPERSTALHSADPCSSALAAATTDVLSSVGENKQVERRPGSDNTNELVETKVSVNPIECIELTGLSERVPLVHGTWKFGRVDARGAHTNHHHQHLRLQNKSGSRNKGPFRSARAAEENTEGRPMASRIQTQAATVPIRMGSARASTIKAATADLHSPAPVKFPPTWRRVTESKPTFARENGTFLGGVHLNGKGGALDRRAPPEQRERPRSSHRPWGMAATTEPSPPEDGKLREVAQLMSERKHPPTLIQKNAHK